MTRVTRMIRKTGKNVMTRMIGMTRILGLGLLGDCDD